MMKSQKSTLVLLSLVLSALIVGLPAQSWAATGKALALRDIENSFVEIAEQVKPSVVHLVIERRPLKGLEEKMEEEDFQRVFMSLVKYRIDKF